MLIHFLTTSFHLCVKLVHVYKKRRLLYIQSQQKQDETKFCKYALDNLFHIIITNS